GMATMFAIGGGALISKSFGSGNILEANLIFRQVFKFLLILSFIISLICFLFTGPIVKGLGATADLYESAKIYLRFYSIFCIPNIIGIALNSFIRNDENPKLAMIATIAGAITNIGLDYLFIFPLKLGLFGAALATGLGQLVTVSILLLHFIFRKGKLRFGNVKLDSTMIKKFSVIGFPSFFAEAAFSIIIYLTNIALIFTVGEVGITTYSIINYLTTPIYMLLLGLAFGAQPLISYHFGAKEVEPMLTYYRLTNRANYLLNLLFIGICFFFGQQLISIFTSDEQIIEMSYIGLNLANAAFIIIGVNLNTTIYYQAIEITKYSNLICACRSVIFLPVVLFILTKLFGLPGIWLSLLVSELLTMLFFLIFTNIKVITKNALN
ncbi:MAG: polysaccharide biosynthesis C-terminal domain-containing protein, partial [Turicibacter sp.]|nr:polysaccharide biosynthesis C-terminal domain-containing protein [Turicibacter sp.]